MSYLDDDDKSIGLFSYETWVMNLKKFGYELKKVGL